MQTTDIAMLRRLPDVVAEYDTKKKALAEAVATFKQAGNDLMTACTVGGTYGRESIDTGNPYEHKLEKNLLKSAWLHIYDGLNIPRIASAKDKKLFEQALESPAPFTMDNIRATFGRYIADPRQNILRGLAEVFCDLDPAYKSHDKVKIGVKGLPKRIILGSVASYGWGSDRIKDILNALAQYQGKPMVSYEEVDALLKREDALLSPWTGSKSFHVQEPPSYPARGVYLKRFANGNGHLFFEPDALRDINLALAEYYGDVLADCTEDGEPVKPQESRAVAKDLQYYPTPVAVVERVLQDLYPLKGERVLEPSCGCGRFMDELRKRGAQVYGIEVDPGRVREARAKGHDVLQANFLETVPQPIYDRVIMNPPFYGKHYAKHIRHALKFLKPEGTLTAILPITARYDHGLLDDLRGKWSDLPVGSFAESGTNINTTIFTA